MLYISAESPNLHIILTISARIFFFERNSSSNKLHFCSSYKTYFNFDDLSFSLKLSVFFIIPIYSVVSD